MKRNKALYALLTVISVLASVYFLYVENRTPTVEILTVLSIALTLAFVVLFSLECDKINKK